MSRTSSALLMYNQFLSCVQETEIRSASLFLVLNILSLVQDIIIGNFQ